MEARDGLQENKDEDHGAEAVAWAMWLRPHGLASRVNTGVGTTHCCADCRARQAAAFTLVTGPGQLRALLTRSISVL